MNTSNKRLAAFIPTITLVIYAISSWLYYLQIKKLVFSTEAYSDPFLTPAISTGMSERLDFVTTLLNTFPATPTVIGSILLIILLEIIFIKKIKSVVKKLPFIVGYQLMAVVLFFGTFFINGIVTTEILNSKVPEVLQTYDHIDITKIITDQTEIKNIIKSTDKNFFATKNPLLANVEKKTQKNFFETHIIPRYIKYHEDTLGTEFKKYSDLPYYLIPPNYFVVNDNMQFTRDLVPDIVLHSINLAYGPYVATAKPEIKIIPREEFGKAYRDAQVARFKRQLAQSQKVITDNDKILAQAKAGALRTDSLPTFEAEVARIKTEQLGYMENTKKIIESFSDPESTNYKSSELVTGGFIPPNSILIQESTDLEVNEIIRLSTHETLHYYADSYAKGLDTLPKVIFEGFTEYLTLLALGYTDETAMIINSGYPVHVQIIQMLAKKIPLSDIEKINFTQDDKILKQDLITYFPSVNYEEFSKLSEEVNGYWFNGGFGKTGLEYRDDPLVLKAKQMLESE